MLTPTEPWKFSMGGDNFLIVIFALVAIAMALLMSGSSHKLSIKHSTYSRMFRFVILFLIVNAAITATFSTVIGRFQSRVFWVLVFLCMLYLVNLWLIRRSSKEKLDNT